jgi:methyl-accepting chemotaxis protein
MIKQVEHEEIDGEIVKEADTKELEMVNTIRQINSLLKYVTELDYVKNMLLDTAKQAELIEGVAASSQQMTTAIEDISNYVEKSSDRTNQSIHNSNDSIDKITQAFKKVEASFEASKAVQDIMVRLNIETKKINEMVEIIKGVANQTNLLALNASIEAARAGEHGRGFAVVADEIKKLAESTKEQVDFINTTVHALTVEIGNTDTALTLANESFNEGRSDMDTALGTLESVRGDLDEVGKSFCEISANIEEQTAASQEMASAITVVNDKSAQIKSETNRTGSAFNDVSKMINSIRLEALESVEKLDHKTQIELSISDHLIWRWRVYNMLLGYEKLHESDVGSHKECRLGQWCSGCDMTNGELKALLQAMDIPHEELHSQAKKAIREYNSGRVDLAEATLKEMDLSSKKVVGYLNKIKRL